MNIVVQKVGEKWVATYNGRHIASAICKSCVISVVKSITSKSDRYKSLTVINEDNSETSIPIGVTHARNLKNGL